jgi:hypothetical protein
MHACMLVSSRLVGGTCEEQEDTGTGRRVQLRALWQLLSSCCWLGTRAAGITSGACCCGCGCRCCCAAGVGPLPAAAAEVLPGGEGSGAPDAPVSCARTGTRHGCDGPIVNICSTKRASLRPRMAVMHAMPARAAAQDRDMHQ